MKDIKFLAGMYMDYTLPAEKVYILKYFRSELEQAFVRYYNMFGEIDLFIEHTGFYCQFRWVRILKKRFDKIVNAHTICKKNFELQELSKIEAGDFKVT
jgi:hypothetical protein